MELVCWTCPAAVTTTQALCASSTSLTLSPECTCTDSVPRCDKRCRCHGGRGGGMAQPSKLGAEAAAPSAKACGCLLHRDLGSKFCHAARADRRLRVYLRRTL
eukprot:5570519-Prymnesium_polylepis.1